MALITPEQARDIEEMRAQAFTTKRPTVPALEEILFTPLSVLDHGFVRVVDYLGDDAAIVQAARTSYGRGTKKISTDRGLLRYLMRKRHTSPFEMCEIKLHVKLPFLVARQWIRQRMASVNEYSARYSILDREFYLPNPEDLAEQSATNRQGRGRMLEPDEAARVLEILRAESNHAHETYEWLLNDQGDGTPDDSSRSMLARELARMNLTLNFYTQWYWKIDLHNLFRFLGLRADRHAQLEIRKYAEVIIDQIVRPWVPLSCDAFEEYQLHAFTLSRTMRQVVKRLLKGEQVSQQTSGLSGREWEELAEELDLAA